MVLISFSTAKEAVQVGIKNMTIRKLRKYPIKKGDKLQLYWKSRTKECEKLKDAYCLFEAKLTWGQMTSLKHRNVLAQLDSFKDWYELVKWFYSTHKGLDQNTKLQIICWDELTTRKLKEIIYCLNDSDKKRDK